MKGIICWLLFTFSSFSAFAMEYHEAKNEIPKENQLFMWVEVIPGLAPCDRQTIYIGHYRECMHLSKIRQWGWLSFDMNDLEMMLHQGTPIHYLP